MTDATEHLGTFAGDPVSIRRDGERIFVTVGPIKDLEYPLDLNGSLEAWVARRIGRTQ